MIDVLANSLLPVFVGFLLGYAAGLRKVVDNKDVRSLVSFLMTFALPCSLFVTIARAPRQLLSGPAKGAVVLAIVYVVVFVATCYASRSLGEDTPANSAVLALTHSRHVALSLSSAKARRQGDDGEDPVPIIPDRTSLNYFLQN